MVEMSDEEPKETTTVCFRIFAENLNPDELSQKLGITPDHSHFQGERPKHPRSRTTYKQGGWLLYSKLPDEAEFEAHLENILSILEPHESYIRELSVDHMVDFYCVLYEQDGLTLHPHILGKIARHWA